MDMICRKIYIKKTALIDIMMLQLSRAKPGNPASKTYAKELPEVGLLQHCFYLYLPDNRCIHVYEIFILQICEKCAEQKGR